MAAQSMDVVSADLKSRMSELPYLLPSGQGFEAPCAPGREIDTFRFNDSFADPRRINLSLH